MKISTLAAFGALSVASAFGAQAQTVTVDGILNANEIGAASAGKYVVLGTYPYAHGFGDAGLLSMYAANSATKIYLFLGGTLQPYKDGNGNNSFQIYLSVPGLTGVPTGTVLPSPISFATSFGKMNGKRVDYDWSGRISKVNDKAVDYDWSGRASKINDASVEYGWATVNDRTRAALCLAALSFVAP